MIIYPNQPTFSKMVITDSKRQWPEFDKHYKEHLGNFKLGIKASRQKEITESESRSTTREANLYCLDARGKPAAITATSETATRGEGARWIGLLRRGEMSDKREKYAAERFGSVCFDEEK